MKSFKFPIFFIFLFVFSLCVNGQQLKENELVVIQGKKYVLHQVRTGETIYSISKYFKVDRSVLIENNPKISEGLDIGEILKIPFNKAVSLSEVPGIQKGDPTSFETHKIKSRKETPYFIAQLYGITVEEIYAYNPSVRKFKRKVELKIPRWEIPTEKVSETKVSSNQGDFQKELQEHIVLSGETLYSISKKFKVSESEIVFYNPEAKNLKAGSKIYLPKVDFNEVNISEEGNIVSDANYFEHIIESGETMWGITRKYKVKEEDLKGLNPVLRTAFPAGVVIKIPVEEIESTQAKAVNENAFQNHLVEPGETLFGLSVKYEIGIPDIKKYNPILENRNLVIGETILIPNKTEEFNVQVLDDGTVDSMGMPETFYEVELSIEIPESCVVTEFNAFSNSTYDVALFLPLFLQANDTLNREVILEEIDSLAALEIVVQEEIEVDTLVEEVKTKELFKQFYGNSENFLQFYEGVLIAIDSMKQLGMNINLHVFDTENNPDSIRRFLYDSNFLETDLIIGPVYQNVQNEVAQIAAKNRIPMVSPFTSRSDLIGGNSKYYQINPSQDYVYERTAEMVSEEYYNSNFIVVKTSDYKNKPEGKLVDLIQEKIYNSGFMSKSDGVSFSVYDFKNEGPFGLRRILSKKKENVILIPSSVEGELSVAISNINNLADDYSITLIGTNNYQMRYPSIEVAHYHNLKLKYIYPFWVDYEKPGTIQFVEKFKSNFGTEPNFFGSRGFDVTYYFLNALSLYGMGFEDCLPYLHLNLVQGNYHFEKVSSFGGYMNQGVSVISYTREFDVVRSRVKGQPKIIAGY